MHYNLRKHFFSDWIVAVPGGLPNIVVSSEYTNIFLNRLDKFYVKQEFKFDLRANIIIIIIFIRTQTEQIIQK